MLYNFTNFLFILLKFLIFILTISFAKSLNLNVRTINTGVQMFDFKSNLKPKGILIQENQMYQNNFEPEEICPIYHQPYVGYDRKKGKLVCN